jgi:DNA-binding response OmpR family regulator
MVVEDDFRTAMAIEDLVRSHGFDVVGPLLTLGAALQNVSESSPDFAILDIKVGGESSYPLADLLTELSIPFIFLTAYARKFIPIHYAHAPKIDKPFVGSEILHAIRSEFPIGAETID